MHVGADDLVRLTAEVEAGPVLGDKGRRLRQRPGPGDGRDGGGRGIGSGAARRPRVDGPAVGELGRIVGRPVMEGRHSSGPRVDVGRDEGGKAGEDETAEQHGATVTGLSKEAGDREGTERQKSSKRTSRENRVGSSTLAADAPAAQEERPPLRMAAKRARSEPRQRSLARIGSHGGSKREEAKSGSRRKDQSTSRWLGSDRRTGFRCPGKIWTIRCKGADAGAGVVSDGALKMGPLPPRRSRPDAASRPRSR